MPARRLRDTSDCSSPTGPEARRQHSLLLPDQRPDQSDIWSRRPRVQVWRLRADACGMTRSVGDDPRVARGLPSQRPVDWRGQRRRPRSPRGGGQAPKRRNPVGGGAPCRSPRWVHLGGSRARSRFGQCRDRPDQGLPRQRRRTSAPVASMATSAGQRPTVDARLPRCVDHRGRQAVGSQPPDHIRMASQRKAQRHDRRCWPLTRLAGRGLKGLEVPTGGRTLRPNAR
jgi:hypothetical protein